MKVLVTGSNGFIGKNIVLRLREQADTVIVTFVRDDANELLEEAITGADAIIHLAGENRPRSTEAFERVNVGLTRSLCHFLRKHERRVPVVFASSTQALQDNPYGRSKLEAELQLTELSRTNGVPVSIYRLPGVFGKWCRPNYNSVVATFCHNIANDLPIQISDPDKIINLVYVDDVVTTFLNEISKAAIGEIQRTVNPVYSITLAELARQVEAFKNCRKSLISERVGTGLVRALYATYVSYLPKDKFIYDLPTYSDARGVFVEMLKTQDSGQFSFFTAHPGQKRGGHYHHSKTEKFLVLKGKARFAFRHILTDETYFLDTNGEKPQVVETVPGWTHDITNVGDMEMIVMLWVNEIFDRNNPDTIACKV